MTTRHISTTTDAIISNLFNTIQSDHFASLSAFNTGKDFPSYPHCNVTCLDRETKEYVIEVALAGVEKENITVSIEPFKGDSAYPHFNLLKIEAMVDLDEKGREYIHRGIKNKDARLSLLISIDDEVKSCEYKNGLLRLTMVRVPKQRDDVKYISID